MRAIVQQVFEAVENEIQDDIPEEFIRRYRLLRKRDALYRIHFPSSSKDVDLAVRTLKYEEFLHFFTSVIYMRSKDVEEGSKPVRVFSVSKIRDKLKQLPFTFTKDQLQALNDILADLSSPKPMYRLVQGDVGCGKTAVAVFALYAAVLAGYQAALLAPTEILARQHLLSLKEMLGSEVRAGLLYSGLSKEEKKNMLEGMADGSIQIVVGTHALLQENVMFHHLGLVVTDEQQRFGVEQRRALVRKGDGCDFLLMSATPIPRTLASALFGEMNISTIHTMPKGRTAPITKRINENSFRSVLDEVRQLLSDGRQLYIICAAVEEGESDVRNVETVTENIRKLFPQYTVASLTGPMKSEEKEAVMNMFACNQAQILVSTTVVEVGMNVVNATGMIIYNAERFGLSQLHQLRGRIQRGSTQGQCWLLSSAREEKTLQRLDTLVSTNDGFVIAQEDLRQRGPGDILGTRQSGIPDFILGSFNDDTNIMDTARKDAAYICEHPDNPDYAVILDRIASRYQENTFHMDIIDWLKNRGITVRKTDLIHQAFMHSSYAHEHRQFHDNERLEFMGDAVLQLWSSNAIFPLGLSEGKMTRLRAQLVCEKALAIYSRELHLNDFLLLGTGEEKTGGRNKDAILADAFEAFLGALFLDQGMDAVDNILNEVIQPRLAHPDDVGIIQDYKTKLQELIQMDSSRTLHYQLVSEKGPANAPEFVMNVIVDGLVLGTGSGVSKKQAEQNAARNAFEKLAK